MDDSTIARLNATNRDFYRRYATSFDAKRQAPWPGWERVAALLPGDGRRSILDVGCGNGRFGLFLQGFLRRPFEYVGIDGSPELLAVAARRGTADWRLVEADLVAPGLPEGLGDDFDLVGCFGVMHHLPGESTRRRVLESMARRVAQGGYLVVSFWQFGDRERFTARALEWKEAFGRAESDLDLEERDFLLPWGDTGLGGDAGSWDQVDIETEVGGRPLRYCHFVNPEEIQRLIDGLGLVARDEFVADGASADLNRYVFLQRTR